MNFPQLRHYWRLASLTHIWLLLLMLMCFLLPITWDYFILFGAEVVLGAGVIGFTIWFTPQRLQNLRTRLKNYSLLLVVVMLLCCVVSALTLQYIPAYAAFAVAMPLTFGLLLWTLYPDHSLWVSKRVWIALALVAAVVITIRVYALSITPPIHRTDEGWAFSWSVNYALTGQLDDPLMRVDLDSYEMRDPLMQLGRFAMLPGLWQRVVGVGYWEARLFNFLLLLLTTAFIVGVAHNWYGRGTALLTVAAMLGSSTLMQLANTRMGAGYTLTTVAALYVSTEADKRNRVWLHFLAGIIAGLGVFAHLHSIAFSAVLTLALFLPRYVAGLRERHWLPPKSALLFVLGGAVVGIAVFIVFILPNTSGFFYTLSSRGQYFQQGFIYSLLKNLFHVYTYSYVELILLIVGVVALVVRRQQHDWNLLLLVIGLHLILSIIAPVAHDQYIRPLAPIYALITGTLLSQGISKLPVKSLKWVQTVTCVFITTILVVFSLRSAMAYILDSGTLRLQPTLATEWIQRHISPDERILAPTEYYLWLPEYTNMRSLYIEALQERELGLELPSEQIWDAVDADYIIYDSTQREDMLPESLFESGYLALHNYVPIVTLHEGSGIVIVYERQSP
jgi:hypothetical protein